MAIDRVKKVWLVSPASDARTLPERLAKIGLVHVAELPREDSEHAAAISTLSADTGDIEGRIRGLTEILEVLSEFSKTSRDLLSNLFPTPIETTREELSAALDAIDIGPLHQQVKDLASRRAAARAAAEKAGERLAALGDFRSFRVTLPAEGSLRWTRTALWLVFARQAQRVLANGRAAEEVTLEQLGTIGNRALVASVCLSEHADEVAMQLREMGFEPVPTPEESTTLDAYVEAIEAERRENQEALAKAIAELTELGKLRHQVELVLGYWEEKQDTARALDKMAATGRAVVLTGYVRQRDLPQFEATLAREAPQVSLVAEDPAPEDDVPVSLTNATVFRPAQFLVEMFGLPGYRAFDPSAFLMLSFVVFFGFCLGDAIYGVVLVAMAWALIRRYRAYPGLRNFFTLLAYCGVSAFIVGALTGTWAADLWKPEYLGEGNFLAKLSAAVAIGDPLDRPLIALGVALGLGIANQFWGITMKMHGYWRRGEKWSALFDGGFWLILLPGLVILIACFFAPTTPAWLPRLGAGLALVGAVGLVLTQGRNEKSIAGKVAVGLVSLYGIAGSYGCVAFIGDTLSYSRLLALGLTTMIVGIAINIIAEMLKLEVAILGGLLFLVVAVPGHFFNLLISGLSAFIHSARLIFVEFFGRFYEPGAQRFAPLGAAGGRIRVTG